MCFPVFWHSNKCWCTFVLQYVVDLHGTRSIGAEVLDSWHRLWRDKCDEEEGDCDELSRIEGNEVGQSFCKSEDEAESTALHSPSVVSRSEGEGEGERVRSSKSIGSASEDERPGFWKRRLSFTYSDRCDCLP
jgi:hypothetical protein